MSDSTTGIVAIAFALTFVLGAVVGYTSHHPTFWEFNTDSAFRIQWESLIVGGAAFVVSYAGFSFASQVKKTEDRKRVYALHQSLGLTRAAAENIDSYLRNKRKEMRKNAIYIGNCALRDWDAMLGLIGSDDDKYLEARYYLIGVMALLENAPESYDQMADYIEKIFQVCSDDAS